MVPKASLAVYPFCSSDGTELLELITAWASAGAAVATILSVTLRLASDLVAEAESACGSVSAKLAYFIHIKPP